MALIGVVLAALTVIALARRQLAFRADPAASCFLESRAG